MTILLDPGHGNNTLGKRSPDGRFLEYKFNRIIASSLNAKLISKGFDSRIIVSEEEDIPLTERCRRVNALCRALGTRNVILVSIHANAAGNGSKWMNARGWSCYTSPGKTKADELATCMYSAAADIFKKLTIRRDFSDGDPDYEENFYILRHTHCPAVLVENFFYDNPEDLRFLESEEGQARIVEALMEGVGRYIALLE